MKVAFLVVFACLVSTSFCQEEVDRDIGNVNKFVDECASELKNEDSEIDPYPVGEFKLGFSKDIFGITVHGEARLNGSMTGLSSMKRTEDVSLIKLAEEHIAYAKLEFPNLKAGYEGSATFMNLGPKVSISVEVQDACMGVTFTMPPNGGPVTVDNVSTHDFGKVKLDIGGFGLMPWAVGKVGEVFLTQFKIVMKKVMEGPMKKLLKEVFEMKEYQPGDSFYFVF